MEGPDEEIFPEPPFPGLPDPLWENSQTQTLSSTQPAHKCEGPDLGKNPRTHAQDLPDPHLGNERICIKNGEEREERGGTNAFERPCRTHSRTRSFLRRGEERPEQSN